MALAGKFENMYATRRSLLSRMKNPEDHESWKDFFDTYSRLVYSVAMKAGLTNTEAEEAAQETFIALTRKMPEFKYDPAIGSFKNWLIKTTQFKVRDQFRKRKRQLPAGSAQGERSEKRTATIDRIPDPASLNLERSLRRGMAGAGVCAGGGKTKRTGAAEPISDFRPICSKEVAGEESGHGARD